MGEREEYAAYLERQSLSKEYEQFLAQKNYQQDMAQGGSIKKAPKPDRMPYGAMAGGSIGGIAGGVVGGPAGAIMGGAGGTIAGELGQQAYETLTGSEQAPQSIGESVGGVAKESFYNLLGEGAGRVMGPTLQRIVRPFGDKLTPEAKEATTYLQGRGVKQPLLPKEASESHALDFFSNVAEGSIMGGGVIKNFKDNREKILDKLVDETVDSFGQRTSKEDLGHIFMDTIDGKKKAASSMARIFYNTVERAMEPVKQTVLDVHTNTYKQVEKLPLTFDLKGAKKTVQEQLKLANSPAIKGIEAQSAGDTIAKEIESLGDNVSYAEIKSLRSRLMSSVDQMKIERKGAPAIGLTNRVIQQLTKEMDDKLSIYDPYLYAVWKEGNAIHAGAQKDVNNRLVRSLMKKGLDEFGANPEYIADAVLKPGAATRVKMIRKAVGEDVWERFQSVAAQDIFKRAELPNGQISGEKLRAALSGRSGYGAEKMAATFSPEQVKNFHDFANALEVVQARGATEGGKHLLQSAQGMAGVNLLLNLTGVADTGFEVSSGAVLFGPAVIAKLMTNPKTAGWLIKGMETRLTPEGELPSGSTEAGVVAGHLLQAVIPRKHLPDPLRDTDQHNPLPAAQQSAAPFQMDQAPQSSVPIPLSKEAIKEKVTKAATEAKLDPKLFHAVVSTESNYNPMAKSKAGAVGLSQLMEGTAKDLGVNRFDVDDNLKGGANNLQKLIKKYNGDVGKALAAYNAGPGRVDSGKPLPAETQGYVAKIMMKLKGGKDDQKRR